MSSLTIARERADECAAKSAKVGQEMENMKREFHRWKCNTGNVIKRNKDDHLDLKKAYELLVEKNAALKEEVQRLNEEIQSMWHKPCAKSTAPVWNYAVMFPL